MSADLEFALAVVGGWFLVGCLFACCVVLFRSSREWRINHRAVKLVREAEWLTEHVR